MSEHQELVPNLQEITFKVWVKKEDVTALLENVEDEQGSQDDNVAIE